jgi:hypothetical protein
MQLCLLRRGPNGPIVRFMVINDVLTILGVRLIVIMISMAISLHHGKVPCSDVLTSRRSSSFANLPSTKSPREPLPVFLASFSSY